MEWWRGRKLNPGALSFIVPGPLLYTFIDSFALFEAAIIASYEKGKPRGTGGRKA